LRILVADDNPHVLSALVDLLEGEQGVSVVGAARHVDDAITLATLQRPDAVLVDVHMPDGGGERVVSTVRELLPDVRIVAVSAYLDSDDISRMLATGADMCFPKSVDLTSLLRSLTP